MMKLVREQEGTAGQAKAAGERKKKRKTAGAVVLTRGGGAPVYENLRGLRAEIGQRRKRSAVLLLTSGSRRWPSKSGMKPANR